MSNASEAGRRQRLLREAKLRRADPAHKRRTLVIWGLVIVALAGGTVLVAKNVDFSAKCPGHWHATFAVYVPDANGNPERIDFATPRSERDPSRAYYQLTDDPKMRVSIHMHQSGAEQGGEDLGPTQLHFETNGTCVTLRDAMETIDVNLEPHTLMLNGAHAQTKQTGVWEDSGNQTLQFWLQSTKGTWETRTTAQMLGYQLKDGESTLIAFGNYTLQQVAMMQASIPAPQSRTA